MKVIRGYIWMDGEGILIYKKFHGNITGNCSVKPAEKSTKRNHWYNPKQ